MRVAITHVAARGPYLAGAPPLDEPLASPRARKMMSRSAYLAALALADLLRAVDVSADTRAQVGYFLGVGGSAGSLDDVTALLDASIVDDQFSLRAFGDRGLAACNPLLAFQLMNNFTMCHGAILEGLGGPNSALFSRGAGTIAAIGEAVYAVASGECPVAIAGGADVGTHPVTLAELGRDGHLAARMIPADAAALVALAPSTSIDDVVIEGCAHASGRERLIDDAINDAINDASNHAISDPIADARHDGTDVAISDAIADARHDATDVAISDAITDAVARAMRVPHARHAAPTKTAARDGLETPLEGLAIGDRRDLDLDLLVIAPWGPPAADALRSFGARYPAARVIDVSSRGDAIAASPALALIAAFEALRESAGRALVLTLGIDGDPGAIVLSRRTIAERADRGGA
jgi:hypothetical protein